ncbi:MAG TPA: hypothetical protein VLJ59_10885 [Mycobacteriales bacterium]|nr:hypothetical protein [Mycobacteriales bacterium]
MFGSMSDVFFGGWEGVFLDRFGDVLVGLLEQVLRGGRDDALGGFGGSLSGGLSPLNQGWSPLPC